MFTQRFHNSDFSFTANIPRYDLLIELQLFHPPYATAQLPHTLTFLQARFPQVLTTECFNQRHLPFHQEVIDTKIGHLFEHILLEQLTNHELQTGALHSTYSGRTYWDWSKFPPGRFHIKIPSITPNSQLILKSLAATVILLDDLLTPPPTQKAAYSAASGLLRD